MPLPQNVYTGKMAEEQVLLVEFTSGAQERDHLRKHFDILQTENNCQCTSCETCQVDTAINRNNFKLEEIYNLASEAVKMWMFPNLSRQEFVSIIMLLQINVHQLWLSAITPNEMLKLMYKHCSRPPTQCLNDFPRLIFGLLCVSQSEKNINVLQSVGMSLHCFFTGSLILEFNREYNKCKCTINAYKCWPNKEWTATLRAF